MHASEFLEEGQQVLGQRSADRDVKEERSMTKVVELFNKLHGTNLTVVQGWNFMVMLKLVRAHTGGKFRKDDYTDAINYMALEGEAKSEETEAVTRPKSNSRRA